MTFSIPGLFFPTEINSTGRKTPTTFIPLHSNYNGRLSNNKDVSCAWYYSFTAWYFHHKQLDVCLFWCCKLARKLVWYSIALVLWSAREITVLIKRIEIYLQAAITGSSRIRADMEMSVIVFKWHQLNLLMASVRVIFKCSALISPDISFLKCCDMHNNQPNAMLLDSRSSVSGLNAL